MKTIEQFQLSCKISKSFLKLTPLGSWKHSEFPGVSRPWIDNSPSSNNKSTDLSTLLSPKSDQHSIRPVTANKIDKCEFCGKVRIEFTILI